MGLLKMYAEALKRISPASVEMMHRLLSAALKQAVKWQLVTVSPLCGCCAAASRAQADAGPRRRRRGHTY